MPQITQSCVFKEPSKRSEVTQFMKERKRGREEEKINVSLSTYQIIPKLSSELLVFPSLSWEQTHKLALFRVEQIVPNYLNESLVECKQ